MSLESLAKAIAKAEGFGIPGAEPTLAHNPGDLVLPNWPGPRIGGAGIAVFDTDDEGWMHLNFELDLIRLGHSHVYNLDMTIDQMAHKWTETEQEAWASNVAAALGVSTSTTLREVFAP
jgi:hypothetical protein